MKVPTYAREITGAAEDRVIEDGVKCAEDSYMKSGSEVITVDAVPWWNTSVILKMRRR